MYVVTRVELIEQARRRASRRVGKQRRQPLPIENTCMECEQAVPILIHLGAEYEEDSPFVRVCQSCLRSALHQIQGLAK